jgi:hypothetical protein
MTLLAISFYATHMHFVRSLWQYRQKGLAADSRPLHEAGAPRKGCEEYVGGTFVAFDWDADQVTWQVPINGAAGFCWRDGLLYLNLMRLCETVAIDGSGREHSRFSHPTFNNMHTIVPTRRGFLHTISGLDAIMETDDQGHSLYEWWATEHGYDVLPTGRTRAIDRQIDHRYVVYPTRGQATHVNSARFADEQEQEIVATLFQQGQVISIDRRSGRCRVLLDGLHKPHDVRPYPGGGWVVSNTADHETLLLDKRWRIKRRIAMDFDWVQSSTPLADGSIVIADANNHRLVRVYADGRPTEIRAFPLDWKIFLVQEVLPGERAFFQQPVCVPC